MKETIIKDWLGFEWDASNEMKNWEKHAVRKLECEQVFFNKPLLLHEDKKHSQKENRMYVLGQTNEKRKLFIVFTIRDKQIRVISARSMNKKERALYEKV